MKGVAMPFAKRDIPMLRQWTPDEHFDPTSDRLIIRTTWNTCFIARANELSDNLFVMDREFMPAHLLDLPHKLKAEGRLPLQWDASLHPWEIFLFDGDFGGNDTVFLDMEAAGVGWTCTMRSSFTIESIEPVHLKAINRAKLSAQLSGIHFGEFNIIENAIYDAALMS